MKRILTTTLLMALAAVSVAAECSEADKKALEAFDRAWSKTNEDGDRAAMMALYADDFVGMPAMTTKTAAIESAMKAYERRKADPAGADKVTSDHYIISCTPNSATITHRNVVWTPNGAGGKPETFWTRSVHMLEKRNGKWLAVTNANNGLDEYAVIWYLEQDWNNAVMKRDRAFFEKHFAEDFTSVSGSTGAVTGKKKEIDDMMADKGLEWAATTDMDINVDGDRAFVTGIFHTKGKDDKGVAYDRKVRYIDTWVKRNGTWQAWTSQGTPIK